MGRRRASGRRGSSRLPSFKIDISRGFQEIKQLYPGVAVLENKQTFRELLEAVRRQGRKRSEKLIEAMINSRSSPQLPPSP